MVQIEVTPVRIQLTITNPFRVVSVFVSIVLAGIIVIYGN